MVEQRPGLLIRIGLVRGCGSLLQPRLDALAIRAVEFAVEIGDQFGAIVVGLSVSSAIGVTPPSAEPVGEPLKGRNVLSAANWASGRHAALPRAGSAAT